MADMRSEPSMEDILASIKRIIADDSAAPRRGYAPQSQPAPAAPARVAPPVQAMPRRPDESVLELTQPAPALRPPAPVQLHDEQKPWPPEYVAPQNRAPLDDAAGAQRANERLRQSEAASAQARAASVAAAAAYAEPVSRAPAPSPIPAAVTGGLTVEALVREMLRPMLSEWLDTHMPSIVERMVQQEMKGLSED